MARTLACLVASMTIGATVLDWFQPSPPAQNLPGRPLIAQLREAIHRPAQGDTVRPAWHTIRIDLQEGDPQAQAAATHIILGHDGQLKLTENWRTQSPLGQEGVIRIGLDVADHANQVTPTQWQAAKDLIRSLRQMYEISGRRVVPNDTLTLPVLATGPPPAGPSD